MGLYRQPKYLSTGICLLLNIQLAAVALIVILLDKLLQKSYGLGFGISFFVATNICETIIWKVFFLMTVNTSYGPEFEGAIVALFHLLFTWNNKGCVLHKAFWDEQLPNIMNLIAAVVIFVVVIDLQGFSIEISAKSNHCLKGQ